MPLGPDGSYQQASRIYIKQQPAGTTLNGNAVVTEEVEDAGSVVNQFGLQTLNGQVLPAKINFTIAPNGTNICKVSIQVADNGGQAITKTDGSNPTAPTAWDLDIVLAKSDGTITNLTPSTGLSVVTGTLFSTYVAGKALYIQSNNAGLVEVNITDTGKQGFFVMVQGGGQQVPALSRQLVTGDYG
jgi:hypothetical protein